MTAARLDGGEHHVEAGKAAVGDPGLLTGEHVATVDPLGPGADRGGVGAALGLGDGQRGQGRIVAGQRSQPALLLGLVTQDQDRLGEEAVGGDQVADARAAVRQLLLHEARGQAVGHARAAVLGGQHECGQAEPGRLAPQLPRDLDVGLVDGQGDGTNLAGGELAAQPLDLELLVGERDELVHLTARVPSSTASSRVRGLSTSPARTTSGRVSSSDHSASSGTRP